jgi:SAM-dependent methyltransferase
MAKAPVLPCPHLCVVNKKINPIHRHNNTMIMKLSPTSDARIRHQQLLAQTMRPTTLSLLEKAKVKEGSNALCLDCGEGEVVFHLAKALGQNGKAIGIDPSRESIHTAQQLAVIKKIRNAVFYQNDEFPYSANGQFGIVYGCLQPTRQFDLDVLVNQTWNFLQPGGNALFDVIDLSTFFSAPKNFAFERFLELCTSRVRSHWGHTTFSTQLGQHLSRSGFQQLQQQYVAPAFLRGTSKNLPSLTLSSMQEEVLQQKLTTQDELQVLLYELRNFEQKEYSLISLPGIHQIWGSKA